MVDDRKRKLSLLDDALNLAPIACEEGDRAAAAGKPSLNRWNGRRYSPRYHELLERRRTLPVWQLKADLLTILHQNKVTIIVGDRGTGKTTQVPQFALESAFNGGIVACTQPWKVAAMSASRRVAEEMDVTIGEEVGYCVPFEELSSSKTILKFLTDDMILREAAADPILKKYTIVILDEAHERSMATDLLFVILKNAVHNRSDLRVVILGARDTCQENLLKVFFNNAPIMRLSGCQLQPAEIWYSPGPVTAYVDLAIATTVQIHMERPAGDVLVFLPREQQVDYACQKICQELLGIEDQVVAPFTVVPLYSNLLTERQHPVFGPAPVIWKVGVLPTRKIIISTKVAETSILLDGIVYVVDTGLSNRIVHNTDTWVQTLNVSWISRASACRRADIARRLGNGICFRLYTEMAYHEQLSHNTFPESLTLNLTRAIITMKKSGVDDLRTFGFIDSLRPQLITRATRDLRCLGAVTSEGDLTSLGEMMSVFPLDPQMSAMLIASPRYYCSNEITSIAAMLLVPDCLVWPTNVQVAIDIWKEKFCHVDGDHMTLLNMYNGYIENNRDAQWCHHNFISAEVMNHAFCVRQQLAKFMTGLNLTMCSPDPTNRWYCNNIKLAMLEGYFLQVAHREREQGGYVTFRDNQVLQIDELAFLNRSPEFLLYTGLNTGIMSSVTDVSPAMLLHVAPDYYSLRDMPRCGAKTTLERVLLSWLGNSPEYEHLYDLAVPELLKYLEELQWKTVVPVAQAPEAPAADEQGAGFLFPQ